MGADWARMIYAYVGNAYKRLNLHLTEVTWIRRRRQGLLWDVILTEIGCELVIFISTESSGEIVVAEQLPAGQETQLHKVCYALLCMLQSHTLLEWTLDTLIGSTAAYEDRPSGDVSAAVLLSDSHYPSQLLSSDSSSIFWVRLAGRRNTLRKI